MNPILSVIIAVKDADSKQLKSCIYAIASLRKSNHVNVIIVHSGLFPGLDDEIISSFHSVELIAMEPLGVYSAYNRGLDAQLGDYVLFIGVDDLLLPGLDRVLELILDLPEKPDLIACHSLMQDKGLSGPSKIKGSLIFRNWCHQGLLYSSKIFKQRRYDIKYRMQADHKLNLEILAEKNLKVIYRKDVISHFSSGGLSSTVNDLVFRTDMPNIVRDNYGNFYWLIALIKRKLANLIKGQPSLNR